MELCETVPSVTRLSKGEICAWMLSRGRDRYEDLFCRVYLAGSVFEYYTRHEYTVMRDGEAIALRNPRFLNTASELRFNRIPSL